MLPGRLLQLQLLRWRRLRLLLLHSSMLRGARMHCVCGGVGLRGLLRLAVLRPVPAQGDASPPPPPRTAACLWASDVSGWAGNVSGWAGNVSSWAGDVPGRSWAGHVRGAGADGHGLSWPLLRGPSALDARPLCVQEGRLGRRSLSCRGGSRCVQRAWTLDRPACGVALARLFAASGNLRCRGGSRCVQIASTLDLPVRRAGQARSLAVSGKGRTGEVPTLLIASRQRMHAVTLMPS